MLGAEHVERQHVFPKLGPVRHVNGPWRLPRLVRRPATAGRGGRETAAARTASRRATEFPARGTALISAPMCAADCETSRGFAFAAENSTAASGETLVLVLIVPSVPAAAPAYAGRSNPSCRTGRTSMLPTRAGGILPAIRIASLR